MEINETQLKKLSRVLNVYNEINLDKMAKLIGFRNSLDLEQWILDLPEKYHSYLTIKGKNVIISKNISNINEVIDGLLGEFEKWDGKKSKKILEKVTISKKAYIPKQKQSLSLVQKGDAKLSTAGEKLLTLLSTHLSITLNRFIQVFQLKELADIDDWLLNLPKDLGMFLNLRNNYLQFEKKAPPAIKMKIAENFDNWITKLMNSLTKIDESAIKEEYNRIPSILGKGYHDYFKIDIQKQRTYYLLLHLQGANYFTTKSDYGDREYISFMVNEEKRVQVSNFQPDVIARKKEDCVQGEIYKRNGTRYYYRSPAGRNISRLIKTSKKDFTIKLKNLLTVITPKATISYTMLNPSVKNDIIRVSMPRKMCVKCGEIFKPIDWVGWESKYLTKEDVYICENCRPKLKSAIQKETAARAFYEIEMIPAQALKVRNIKLLIINTVLFLVVGLPLTIISSFFGLEVIGLASIIAIFSVVYIYLILRRKNIKYNIFNLKEKELNRKKNDLDKIKPYDGKLILKALKK